MSLNNYIKVTALSLMCLLGSLPSAMAQFPTLDPSAIGNKAKSITQQVQQYNTQIQESKTVGSINSAIGDAKSSMSKFSTDEIAEAKKKAEKAKKQADKIKKIKEAAEKAKKAYEEKKKQYEEYKQMVADAKEKVNDAKDIANEVKSTVSDAKDLASSAGSLASSAISDATSTVASKTGVSLPSSSSSSKSSSSSVSSATASVTSAARSNTVSSSPSVASFAAVAATSAASSSPFATATTSSDAPFVGNTISSGRTAFRTAADNVNAIKEVAASDGVPAATAKLNKVLNTAVQNGDVATIDAVANMDTADIVNSQSKIYENPTDEPVSDTTSAKMSLSSLKNSIASAKDSISKARTASSGTGQFKSTTDMTTETDAVNDSLNQSKERMSALNNKMSAMQEKLANLKQKTESQTSPDNTAETSGQKTVAELKNNMKALKSDVAKAKESMSKISTTTNTAPINAAVGGSLKDSLLSATSATQSTSTSVSGTQNSILNTVQTPSVSNSVFGTSPATSNGLQINRRTFKGLDKESSLWLKPDFFSQSHSAELSYTQTMSFATMASDCDYNNEIVSGDDGSIVILSPTLAKYCCIKAENLTDPNVIKDCANKLLTEMNDEDSTSAADAQGVYATIMAEQGSYGVAEALDNTNVSSSYQADVLKKFTEDLKNASTTNDAINVVSMTNTQILYLLNRLRCIYTAAAVTSGLSGLGGVKAQTLNEDTDIGIGDVGDKYENSVSLSEIEYPVVPENMAKKCTIKVSEGTDGVKDCYLDAVKGKYAENFKDAEVASNYIENLKYQNTLDTLSKSLYHKVTTAKYDEQLDKIKETSADATTIRTQADGLFNTDYEIQVALEDIVKLLANRIAYTAVDNMSKLEMPETSTATKG